MTAPVRLLAWARTLKRDVVALWIAARDRRVPWHAKAVAAVVAAYALSPIDLIPDFIPVLGYLDDLLLVPLGIAVAVRLVPPPLMAEFRCAAALRKRPSIIAGALFIASAWIAVCGVCLLWLFRRAATAFELTIWSSHVLPG